MDWIDVIYSAFSVFEMPKREKLVDVEFLMEDLPKTVSQSMMVSSATTLSNFGKAFQQIVQVDKSSR